MTFTGTKTEIQQFLYKLDKDTIYDLKIDKHRKKRSLNANNYAWYLINEMANALRLSKEEIYFQMLKNYGQRYVIRLTNKANINDYFEYYEEIHSASTCTDYYIFKGTSKYDSKEMSIFIDGLVQEAKQLGIETLEDLEIKNLIEEMEKNER